MQWLKLISKNKGTMCSGPTFGYEICARRANSTDLEGLDLSSWRVAGIGADMIRPNVLEIFAETFKDYGFDKRAFMPSYGLAECTLAVSFGENFSGYEVDLVSEEVLNGDVKSVKEHKVNGNGANYREVVNCGKPLPEYDLEIRDENDNALGVREIGRVCLKGPSVMVGYYMDEEATKQCLSEDGWLDTGDIGYMAKGSLYIIGRIKDLIIINGKNHWPHDIEWAVEKLPELRSGDSAAISIPGDDDEEVPAILVQCRKRDEEGREDLENRIKTEVQAVIGKAPIVILVPPRSLPRTSSGKLSRVKARRQYLEGQLSAS
jgi:fatty-acyl-CoA synthase